jgi:Spy/CpxP family protein refolding chaperone
MGFIGAAWVAPLLPEDVRIQLRDRMQQRRMDMRERGLQVRQARLAVIKALAADPYDKAAAEQAFSELRQRVAQVQEVMHTTIVGAAADLTPEQRKAMIERLPSTP